MKPSSHRLKKSMVGIQQNVLKSPWGRPIDITSAYEIPLRSPKIHRSGTKTQDFI